MKKTFSILYLLLLSVFSHAQNDSPLKEKNSRIENGLQPVLQIEGDSIPNYNIETRLEALGIPGVSIAVLKDGEIEWAKGYGVADSSENRPVTTETMFLAGSISKPVAAIRAHQLVENGIIDLDTEINTYLSSLQLPDNEFTREDEVTLRRILNHTAGLTVWGFPDYDEGDTIPTIPEVLDGKGNTDAVRVYKKPGESWQYSGVGYTIMQQIITDVEGESFPRIMQSMVLDPLGMKNSTFENPLPERFHSIAATGYRANGTEVEVKRPIYPEMAAAGLWTTPAQLILWAKEIDGILRSQKNGILKTSTVNDMLTPGMNDWGLGPAINEHYYGHGGADEGFRAELKVWKKHPIAVVIMVNSDNGSIIPEILLSMAEEYDLPGVEPTIRKIQKQTKKELERFVGDYRFPELGNAKVTLHQEGLELTADVIKGSLILLPESDNVFFAKDDGTYFEFHLERNHADSFQVQGYTATKLIE